MVVETFTFAKETPLSLRVDNSRVCVISIFGKSDRKNPFWKASPVDDILKKSVFYNGLEHGAEIHPEFLNDICGFYDKKHRTIYLHLVSVCDSSVLLTLCADFRDQLENKGFLDVWSSLNHSYARSLLFLFSVSHIALAVHPTASFDTSYLHLFKQLDLVRQQCIPHIGEILKDVNGISQSWINAGRPCSPRLLFVFMSSPISSAECNEDSASSPSLNKVKQKLSAIKKLEHSLEDKIYKILRKCRIITNTSTSCLFAIPANQEFVHVYQSEETIHDHVGFLIDQLKSYCQFMDDDVQQVSHIPGLIYGNNRQSKTRNEKSEATFDSFMQQHIKLALDKGFDDNVGRSGSLTPAYFELPTTELWSSVSCKVYDYIFGSSNSTDKNDESLVTSTLKSNLDIDVKFSETRCKKVLPVATVTYQEGLPPLYTSDYHQRKLLSTMRMFSKHARGPAYNQYADRLMDECDNFWKNGRQLCETLSLTGNNCANPVHRLSESDPFPSLPIKEHSSMVKMVSTCNCGRTQSSRPDPFTIKTANYDFYESANKECCSDLPDVYEFPVFEPSTINCKEAAITKSHAVEQHAIFVTADNYSISSDQTTDSNDENVTTDACVTENITQTIYGENQDADKSIHCTDDVDNSPLSIVASEADQTGKLFDRLPSTTEYLPNMLNSQSPSGLLPLYPYWSLICLGPSSLYSHNIGIQEQPGFIPGSNFLLPWDVTIKVNNRDTVVAGEIRWSEHRKNVSRSGKGQRPSKDSEINVKIFLGLEYECPLGHRFMCSTPDKVLKSSGSGLIKETANKIVCTDMPLYTNCPCRSNPSLIGQLMRVHIVTPKAPVNVTLNPRVQPAPVMSCATLPLFYPGDRTPIKLTPSTYWILRLPFIYQGDDGPYFPPKELVHGVIYGRLLKGICTVVDTDKRK